jgi:hypothetical protein
VQRRRAVHGNFAQQRAPLLIGGADVFQPARARFPAIVTVREAARAACKERAVNTGRWTRDELYDDAEWKVALDTNILLAYGEGANGSAMRDKALDLIQRLRLRTRPSGADSQVCRSSASGGVTPLTRVNQ